MKLDPLGGKSALEQIRQLEIKAEGDAGQKFQHRHFGAKAVPNRAELKSNRARADDEKFFWHLLEAKRFGTADDGFSIEFRERQLDCDASGGDDNVFGVDLLCFASRRFYRNLSGRGDRAHPLQY